MDGDCFIRVKPETGGQWRFLTPQGGECRSWLFASLNTKEQALRAVEGLRAANPGFLFKAVSAVRGGSRLRPRWTEVS
jgi:hypothetical protein